MTQWKVLLATAALAVAAGSADAGSFTTLLNTGERTPGSTNNVATDAFYISGIPAGWTQLATHTSAVSFDVYNRERDTLLGTFTVGTLIDTVWKDSASHSLIFGTYFHLDDDTHGITEINSIVRSGFAPFADVSAAWTFASGIYAGAADGYRLRDPARSDYQAAYNAGTAATGAYLDLDKVAIRTDISLEEGNPNNGLYLLRVDATGYTYGWSDHAIRVVQGASSNEGGRIFQDTFVRGYTVAAVPEPSSYAMMIGGLGLLAFVARRGRSLPA